MRDPTESIAPDPGDDANLDPLSSSQAPLGTRGHPPRDEVTRIESPAARNRTPPPPTPAQVGAEADPVHAARTSERDLRRGSRPSRPPARGGERPEERLGAVLGSYRLLELLGKGGMGFVYKAEHVKLGRVVALKLLRADYARRRDSVARFFQEARTVNRVRHRNIVDVTDFVELDDGTTFIIMELLEGRSLGKWARAGFSIPRALALLIQICDGLAAAHAVGVVHRDLKPDNVVVVPTGDGAEIVKLLDFGVAKLLNRDDEDIGLETQAGSVIGTPAYMSPEQAGGTTVDGRSDIYSLGAIMYELFTGQPMFKGRSFGEYVRKHLNEHPVPPRRTPGGAAIDDRLEAVILRCIEKDPERRYPNLAALRDDLLLLLGGIETAVGMVRDLASTDSLSSRDLLSGPASHSSLSGSASRSARRSGVESRVSTPGPVWAPPPAPMPLPEAYAAPRGRRWPWLVAGIAIAGAGAAVIAFAAGGAGPATPAARSTPAAAPAATSVPPGGTAPKPSVQPLEPAGAAPAPGARARMIEVRFDATPGGDVYPVGSATKRCSTPCTVAIDPGDGGSPTARDFVVRRPGYIDERVTIDLTRPPPSVAVELERVADRGRRAADDDRGAPAGDGRAAPIGDTNAPDKQPDRQPDRQPDPKPDKQPDRQPDPRPDKQPDRQPDPRPDKQPDPAPDRKIDPTDTIDPFR